MRSSPLTAPGLAASAPSALLVLRAVTGLVFFMHGYQKLFDNGINATQGGFNAMGTPLPDISAVVVTFVELIGGAALIVGPLTRIVALLLTIDMLSAMFIVHVENGFFISNGGVELVLLLAGASVALMIAGAGPYSVDAVLGLAESPDRQTSAG